jgi:hypothetical protein
LADAHYVEHGPRESECVLGFGRSALDPNASYRVF